MKSLVTLVSLVLIGGAAIWAQNAGNKGGKRAESTGTQQPTSKAKSSGDAKTSVARDPATIRAVEKGAKWLASVQGADGGWGQDGGDPSNVRQAVPLESAGNDLANTAVAALALLRAGNQYRPNVERAVDFILRRVESSPADGLSITDANAKPTQIQRKLGPYIDTFLTAMLLAEVDGTFARAANARIRRGLEKCVAKIQKNQTKDGSWNVGGGWAPLLGTSLASRSLYEAGKKGVAVDREVLARADGYTVKNQQDRDSLARGGSVGGAGVVSGVGGVSESVSVSSAAGVTLYQDAQALEQLSRSAESRMQNATALAAINDKLSDSKFVEGYGSIGGEEFFSYLNISDGLKRSGGKVWSEWNAKITQKILKLQNADGTWAGQHCITGRCAVTSAAILNLTSDRVD
ncbi:MAG TPA: prenyltransferase/squalene oxidase repeat-containing protein [Blastocatellia bacterium]|nr:prenyltransferase/squalene oxidase repeat-containing protein [Blastocatellia bacterium]